MTILDLEALRAASVQSAPYAHVTVPRFIKAEALSAIARDYPDIRHPGSFPLSEVSVAGAFAQLVEELRAPEFTAVFAAKFGIAIEDKPVLITVRGHAHERDGRIHSDTPSKLLTVLIYPNLNWPHAGGRLRVLRSPTDLESHTEEIAPEAGNLLAFPCAPDAYHGHKAYEGERRVIQINWIGSRSAAAYSEARHKVSAWTKRLLGGSRRG